MWVLWLALAFFVGAVALFVRKSFLNIGLPLTKSRSVDWLIVVLVLLASIWVLSFGVQLYLGEADGASLFEKIISSLFVSVNLFATSEGSNEELRLVRQMIYGMEMGAEQFWVFVATAIYFFSVIVKLDLLLEVCYKLFPRLKLFFFRFKVMDQVYYFSDLNEAAVAMIGALSKKLKVGNKEDRKVFYVVANSAKEEGLRERLAFLGNRVLFYEGSICEAIDKQKKIKEVFLINDDECVNLENLTRLYEGVDTFYPDKGATEQEGMRVFVFTSNNAYNQVKNGLLKPGELQKNILDVPININRNLILSVLDGKRLPLYAALNGDEAQKELRVSIVGSDELSLEMFLTSYWLGQMMDYKLCFNIVSSEPKEAFWSKVDLISPEIRHSTIERDPVLRINEKGDFAEPYCYVNFFNKQELTNSKSLLETNYFFISLGCDSDNIALANWVYRQMDSVNNKAVIAYVVKNKELSDVLNQQASKTNGIHLEAIGNYEEVYSYDSIVNEDEKKLMENLHVGYKNRKLNSIGDFIGSDYKHWANLARAKHLCYKRFSLLPKTVTDENFATLTSTEQFQKSYAWLEHRRWNAFTRVYGYQNNGTNQKDHQRKLHPCLVETDKEGAKGHQKLKECPKEDLDYLDLYSLASNDDYKIYDYIEDNELTKMKEICYGK